MQAQFPISAADSLIEGYCDDFISLASILAQTLEQVSMRAIDISNSTEHLRRIETGMRELSESIRDLIERGRVMTPGSGALNRLLESEPSVITTAACTDWLSTDPTGTGPGDAAPATPAEDARSANGQGLREQLNKDLGLDLGDDNTTNDRSTEANAPDSDPNGGADVGASTFAGGGPIGGNCLRGNNHTIPIMSVVQFVERMRKTGTMTVSLRDETLTFEFENGYMQGCKSSDANAGDRLGDLLVKYGNCDRARLDAIMTNAGGRTSAQIGEVLVRSGLATNAQIMEALAIQARNRFERACAAEDGDYQFVEAPSKPSDGRVHIALSELAPEGQPQPEG